jgi:hypothetical protein
MQKLIPLLLLSFISIGNSYAQPSQKLPCSNPVYRQFDFWIGEWDVYGPQGRKAGDSKISLILDSCIILEEWVSLGSQNGLTYSGKSFNTWNATTHNWQQTWVDNAGGSTEYLQGKYENNKIEFLTAPFPLNKDTMAIRRLSFYNLSNDKVRQHGEISKDNGSSWITEYDLEYRRKKK